ncbi:MAG: biotin--[acetyl-CoA-carboxylase] ligase [Spirochaetales bacterium]|nr:biotin--[acetyl-CoA-carboxylase] ligase [Spirochaetales bacterium]
MNSFAQDLWNYFNRLQKENNEFFLEQDCLEKNKIQFYQEIDSTNSYLLRQLSSCKDLKSMDGTFVCAASQTKGKGRLGRKFYSPAKSGIYFSYVCASGKEILNPAFYTISAAVGVCRGIKKYFGLETQIKWVNDIYYNQKKVSGILAEGFLNSESGKVEAAVVGIGINFVRDKNFPEEISCKAGGLFCDENKKINAAEFVAECMFEIFSIIRKKENVIEEYKNRSMLIGETVTVTPVVGVNKTDFKAKIISITDDAGLEVELENGNREVLHCGEISLHNNL